MKKKALMGVLVMGLFSNSAFAAENNGYEALPIDDNYEEFSYEEYEVPLPREDDTAAAAAAQPQQVPAPVRETVRRMRLHGMNPDKYDIKKCGCYTSRHGWGWGSVSVCKCDYEVSEENQQSTLPKGHLTKAAKKTPAKK